MFLDDIKLVAKNERGLDSLIQTVRVLNTDIGMKFRLEKCAMLVMKKGSVKIGWQKLPDDKVITSIHDENGYKYLGILQLGGVKMVLKSKLKRRKYNNCHKHLGSAINSIFCTFP